MAARRIDGRVILVLAAVAGAVLLAGCSSSPSSSSPTTAKSTTTTATPATLGTTTTSGSAAPPVYEVETGTVAGLGKVLVDGQGLTLYLFIPDRQSNNSTCYGRCAEGWPPLILPVGVTKPVAGAGVDASLLGTTKRTDGSVQVTYNRWPLYTWVGDSEPGQATGQALNNDGGLWYVVSPQGKAIVTTPHS